MRKIMTALFACFFLMALAAGGCSKSGTAAEPAPANTPGDIAVDNFEDGNTNNCFNTWYSGTVSGGGTSVITWGVEAAPPGNGSYACRVSVFAAADDYNAGTGFYNGIAQLNSGPTAAANEVDVSTYSKLVFSASFDGTIAASATPVISVDISNNVYYASQAALTTFDPVFKEYQLDLASFTPAGGTLNEILSACRQVRFMIMAAGSQDDTMSAELMVDDIRFVK